MVIAGDIYGVVLNDRQELHELTESFFDKPYLVPPVAPVVYMKPRSAVTRGPVRVKAGEVLQAASTLALLFARDAARCSESDALDCVGAACLAIDFSLPQTSYYRPAVGQKNRDGFLALGDWIPFTLPSAIDTHIDGKVVHDWPLDRLLRSPAQLIADLSAFMTLRAGDVLLVGLPGDAPHIGAGQSISVSAPGLPAIHSAIEELAA